jgi:putative membrane protein
MKTMSLAVGLALLVAPAFAQSLPEKTGVNSVVGIAPKTADFVQEAATSDMFEIQSSRLAVAKSDAATKAFAQQMINDHEKTSADLKGMVSAGKVRATLPSAMTSSQQKMLDKLKGLTAAEFTKQYHTDQVSAHKAAVDLFKRYGDKGDDAGLKVWAANTRPALEHHLMMAQDLNK